MNKKPKYSLLQNMRYMFHTSWTLDKTLILFTFGTAILNLCQNMVQLFIAPMIIQKVEQNAPLEELLLTIFVFCVLLLSLAGLIGYFTNEELDYGLRIRLSNHLTVLATKKACTTSYPNTLRANYWETCDRSIFCIGDYGHGCSYMIATVGQLFQAILGFVLYLFLLSGLNPLLLLLVITTTVTGYFVSRKMSEWGYLHRDEAAKYRKTIRYISNEIMANEMPKDIRIFGMQKWLSDIYDSALSLYENFCERREKKHLIANLLDVILLLLRNGLAYFYLIQMALKQNISASAFLLYFSAVTGFTNWVTTILDHAIKLHRQSLNTNEYRELLEYPEPFHFEDGLPLEKDLSKKYTITLENVSFRYPDTEKDTLSHINLTIHAGEKLAIVGLNGAGKTTLVKLVCGFLDPTKGRVLLNGKDIREFNRLDYYNLFSAVFQDFSRLQASIAANVAQNEHSIDYENVFQCIEKAGLSEKLQTLPKGLETHLGRILHDDGIELSGGEIQRLMLARALYKNAPILVLDEPTAALDPIAENDIYLKYNVMTKGRTSLYISHRLASTQFCDRIIFLANGQITEEGTHQSLLAANGGYANLFEVQSKYYKEHPEGVSEHE
ncbi:MAG: ABC transporter ATP-binding protein [Agathobacter sp.]|nr:ABC transporter ATP-binding protein [Agathobacter sp.]